MMRFDRYSLTAWLVLTLVAIALGTILLIGLPTAWLVRHELEQQAAARLDQAVRVSQALYEAQRREAAALAMLTAQRPTLRDLVRRGDTAGLDRYLGILRAAAPAGLDAIVVVDPAGRRISRSAEATPLAQAAAETLTHGGVPEQGAVASVEGGQGLIIAAEAPILPDASIEPLGVVRVAFVLDDLFVAQLKSETGLEHSLVAGAGCVATTLAAPDCPSLAPSDPTTSVRRTFGAGGLTYYAAWLPLRGPEGGIVGGDEVALPATEISVTAGHIYAILLVSSALFAVLVAALGYVLARRITAPLLRLAEASEAIGRGDLSTPLPGPADSLPRFRQAPTEIRALGQTLEQMRRRLKAAYDELNRSKTWSENLIAALTEGVVTVDAHGRITSFSPGAERILGWRSQEVIGRRYEAVFRPAQSGTPPTPTVVGKEGAARMAAYRPPGALEREHILTRDGQPIVISVTGGALIPRDGGEWEQAHVFRDVTAEEEALRLRESFLASVSHEFKTPLAALRAAIELLSGDGPALSADELRELMDSILLGVLRLEELVDNLLSSASIQAGQFEVRPRPVDLGSIAEEVLLTTRPLLALRGQSLELEIPAQIPPVQADPRRLAQVLVNLISNASKYGPPARPIRLQAKLHPEGIMVRVADEGPGIPLEKRGQFFRPFKRPADDGGTGGVGLGLSIVKTIVERHHGQVGVESDGRGTVFWFTLPLATPETSDAKRQK